MQISNEELNRAAERVREMQRRSAFRDTPHPPPTVPEFVRLAGQKNTAGTKNTPQKKQSAPPPQQPPKKTQNNDGFSILQMLNFKNIIPDNDRTLLLGLIILLSSENADTPLLLALLYIML